MLQYPSIIQQVVGVVLLLLALLFVADLRAIPRCNGRSPVWLILQLATSMLIRPILRVFSKALKKWVDFAVACASLAAKYGDYTLAFDMLLLGWSGKALVAVLFESYIILSKLARVQLWLVVKATGCLVAVTECHRSWRSRVLKDVEAALE